LVALWLLTGSYPGRAEALEVSRSLRDHLDLRVVALERAVALETIACDYVSAALWLTTGSSPGWAVALRRAVALDLN
jgi:hypothetical protein